MAKLRLIDARVRVLIAIHGAHSEPERMAAQRETWLKDLKGADYKYFLGVPESVSQVAVGDDIVHLCIPDGPLWEGHRRTWVINRKTVALAQFAIKNGYDYVFKCDDDTYVRTDKLLSSGFEAHDYTGFMASHYDFESGHPYEWAQGGAGYWLSHKAMLLVATGLTRIRAEDFAVGQLLALNGIAAHHDDRYQPAVTQHDIETPDSRMITFHKVDPESMRRLHNGF